MLLADVGMYLRDRNPNEGFAPGSGRVIGITEVIA